MTKNKKNKMKLVGTALESDKSKSYAYTWIIEWKMMMIPYVWGIILLIIKAIQVNCDQDKLNIIICPFTLKKNQDNLNMIIINVWLYMFN